MGLGKGKKKAGKLGTMEKKQLPVETDPQRLVKFVCGSNIYATGDDVKVHTKLYFNNHQTFNLITNTYQTFVEEAKCFLC